MDWLLNGRGCSSRDESGRSGKILVGEPILRSLELGMFDWPVDFELCLHVIESVLFFLHFFDLGEVLTDAFWIWDEIGKNLAFKAL